MNWSKNLKVDIAAHEPLARLTSFKIGGDAQYYACPGDCDQLRELLKAARLKHLPIHILGAGSNLLISDRGVQGLVVRLDAGVFKKVAWRGACVEAGAGVSLARLVREASQNALSGFECLAGIPGTVGGSLVMNAGAWGGTIADTLVDVTVLDSAGRLKTIAKKNIRFGYRTSNLTRYIVTAARFKLVSGKSAVIEAAVQKNLSRKKEQQDLSKPSAGCIFKNPPGKSAGQLIDQCGLKGVSVGGACVSSKHANFILNDRKASAGDVVTLMALIRKNVQQRFGIVLKPEVKIWE